MDTVDPETKTGSRFANGVTAPVRPTFTSIDGNRQADVVAAAVDAALDAAIGAAGHGVAQ